MAEPVYTFDRQSMRRISAAVQKSEGVKDRKGNKWYPVRGGGGAGATLQFGKTKPFNEDPAFWETDSHVDLYVYERKPTGSRYTQKLDADGNPVVAENIYNMFGPVLPDSWVQWQGALRTDSQQDILFGKTQADWRIGDRASIIPLDDDETVLCNPGFRVLNLFADVKAGKWVAFMPNVYTDAILISAECG